MNLPARQRPQRHRKRNVATLGVAAGTATILAAGIAAPAQAQSRTIADPVGDAFRFGDISAVKLNHARDVVFVKVSFAPRGQYSDNTVVYLDTVAGNGKPEFLALADTDAFGTEQTRFVIRKTKQFGGFRGSTVCTRQTLRVEDERSDSIRMPIPRRCLADPKRVRVSVNTSQEVGGRQDWSPAVRKYGPWAARD